jgi:hypothetical protein
MCRTSVAYLARAVADEAFWVLQPSSLAAVIVVSARHVAALSLLAARKCTVAPPLVPHALTQLLGVELSAVAPLVERLVQCVRGSWRDAFSFCCPYAIVCFCVCRLYDVTLKGPSPTCVAQV